MDVETERAWQGQTNASSYTILTYQADQVPLEYRNVILARWLRSLKRLNEYFKLIDNDSYFSVYEKYLKVILSRPNTIAKFAVLSDDHDTILGWSVIEGNALHYVHVQELSRKAGIAKTLIPKNIKYVTHITRHWDKYLKKHYKDVLFNPFI